MICLMFLLFMYLEMCLHDHSEVSVVCLGHVLLVLAQLDGHDVAEMRTRVVPAVTGLENQAAKKATMSPPGASHETKNKSFLGSRDFVGGAKHLLGLQHLLLGQRQVPPLRRHRGLDRLHRGLQQRGVRIEKERRREECWE